jgi:hypothetical protein
MSHEQQSRECSLRFVDQEPIDHAAAVDLDGRPPSDIWAYLGSQLTDAIARGVDNAIESYPNLRPTEAVAAVISTDAMEYDRQLLLASIVTALGRHSRATHVRDAVHMLAQLESNELVSGQITLDADDMASILRLVETDAPVLVRLDEAFKSQRADQRRQICSILSRVAAVVDVEIAAPGRLFKRWFAHAYEGDLPGSLREQCSSDLHGQPGDATQVGDAMDALDVDAGVVDTLRAIAATPNESKTIDQLVDAADVDRDGIHWRLNRLREFDLVSGAIQSADSALVSLQSNGRAYLDAVRESAGFQAGLDESLRQTGKSSHNLPCNPAHAREGGDRPGWNRNRLPHLHQLRDVDRSRYVAATAATPDGGVSVTDTAVDPLDDRAAPGIFYDHDRRRLLVSAEFDNPMSYMVCVARALADEQIWSWILDDEALEDADKEKIKTFFDDHRGLLRGSRCLGYLPDEDVQSLQDYREQILDARDQLLEMTKRLTQGDYEDRKQFRGTITADAHGLAGTMAHLLDLADVEIVRECRIPRYRELTDEQRGGLVRMLSLAASIQSRYGETVVHRQLFEDRDEKRECAIEASVDAGDPFGDLIGSFAIIGDFGDHQEDFVDDLSTSLRGPKELHEDAPQMAVRIPVVDDHDRAAYAKTVTRMCRAKHLKPTPQAVSTLAGIAASPYEAAAALEHLDADNDDRQVRSSELRFALSNLDVDEILRGTSSTPRKAVKALLCSDEPLNQTELADEAGVSARSLRTHLPDLIDIGIVSETPTGYRFALAFQDDEERYEDIYPTYVAGEASNDVHKAAMALRTANKHIDSGVPDDEFPTSPTGRPWCADLRNLDELEVWVEDILPLLWGIEIRETYRDDPELGVKTKAHRCQMGPQFQQLRLGQSTNEVAG